MGEEEREGKGFDFLRARNTSRSYHWHVHRAVTLTQGRDDESLTNESTSPPKKIIKNGSTPTRTA